MKMDSYNFVLDIVGIWIFVSTIIDMNVFISVAFQYVLNQIKFFFGWDETINSFDLILPSIY